MDVSYHLDDGETMRAKLLRTDATFGYLELDLRTEPGCKYVGKPEWFAADYVASHHGVVPECAVQGKNPGEWDLLAEPPAVDIHRTVPLIVVRFDDWPEYSAPGQAARFAVTADDCVLHHTCPGCGRFGGIRVGFTSKPVSPGWLLTAGAPADPVTWTLRPSILCKGCCGWHGYLTQGVFTPC